MLAVSPKLPYEAFVDKEKNIQKTSEATRIEGTRRALLEWHEIHGRHDLPWRRSHDPYQVLVSEFMLQQTTVATVIPRFNQWMKLFPTLSALADAGQEAVLAAWQGLGYYSRARRLHATSRAIVARHGGVIPTAREDLLALPGIGEYTAAAILAFAYNHPSIVLDTNIARVIARWNNLEDPIDTTGGQAALREAAVIFFHPRDARAMTSALMDLGAILCTARTPKCNSCPLQQSCQAISPESLPKKSPRAVTTRKTEHRAWIVRNGRLFLEHSQGPLWQGLWILPELGTTKPTGRTMTKITYPITRYRVVMKVYPAGNGVKATLEGFSREELEEIAIPTPHRLVISKLWSAIAADGITGHTAK